MTMSSVADSKSLTGDDRILDYAIEYVSKGCYRENLTANEKRAVRKRAKKITVDRGQVFLNKKGGKVSLQSVYCRCSSQLAAWLSASDFNSDFKFR